MPQWRLLQNTEYLSFVVSGTTAVIEARIAKIVMIGSLAMFALMVTFDNITDYDTNFEFVHHVFSMDTIFPGSTLLKAHPAVSGWPICSMGVPCAGDQRRAGGDIGWLGRDR
jgi:hypothetical protein